MVRHVEIYAPFDVPRTPTGWAILADAIEARFSYMNRPKLHGNVGMGFTWSSNKGERSVSMTWIALEKHVLPRIIDAEHVTRHRILESSIEPTANSSPRLGLRIEGS